MQILKLIFVDKVYSWPNMAAREKRAPTPKGQKSTLGTINIWKQSIPNPEYQCPECHGTDIAKCDCHEFRHFQCASCHISWHNCPYGGLALSKCHTQCRSCFLLEYML